MEDVIKFLFGKTRIQLTSNSTAPVGSRYGNVLNEKNEVIGSASDYPYGASGFAVHTKPVAGFVPIEQIEFVKL